jgi:transcriptional regulator with XRE-family HTH domain
MDLAMALRRARESKGWSQRELALVTGCTWGLVGHLETGRRVPSLTMLQRLAKALGTTPSAILRDAERGGKCLNQRKKSAPQQLSKSTT